MRAALAILASVLATTACGVDDTATATAAVAIAKQRELENARAAQAQIQQQIDAAVQAREAQLQAMEHSAR